ncbi:protein of unknown function (plasmid) [Vibrio harveyi]|nr:protein of unknown function [Vibrio harveyi]
MIEKKTIIPKDRSQRVWKCQRNVLILILKKDMLLLSYPLFCRFNATTAAKARFTHLVNVFVMNAVGMTAFILFRTKAAVLQASILVTINDDGSEGFPIFIEIAQPSIVGIEELFNGLIRKHDLYMFQTDVACFIKARDGRFDVLQWHELPSLTLDPFTKLVSKGEL